MKNFVKAFDNLPWIIKLILCLPVLDILWAVYRIIKGADSRNTLMIVIGIIWIVFGCVITWVADLVCTIIWKRPMICA